MAKGVPTVPANFPQPLGNQLLKAETQRQISMIRQEIVTELLTVLPHSREVNVRARLIRLIEANLRAGMSAAERASHSWPNAAEAREVIQSRPESKPAQIQKHLKVLDQFERVHHRSIDLLRDSFENIQLILDRIQPTEPVPPPPASKPAAPPPKG